jgi:outer membrane protein TolC
MRMFDIIRIVIMITAVTFFLPVNALPEEGIPLEKAVQKAMERAAEPVNSVLEEKIKELEARNAQMKKYFSMDSNASYLFKSEQMEVSLPGKSVKAGAKHNYDLNLSLHQPIYTGNILGESVKVSESQLAAARNRTRLETMDTAAAVKSSYFNYRLLLNKKESMETFIRKLNLHLENLEKLYEEEQVRKTDLLETRQKLREQEITIEELNHLIASEKITFERLCGLDIDTVETGYTERTENFENTFKTFKSSHPLLKVYDNRFAAFTARGKIVKGEYLPQVSGFAELHYGRPGIDFFKNEWGVYFQGGIGCSLKLFDWNKRKRDLKILDYETRKLENERDDFILEVEKQLKQLFDSLQSVEKRVSILDDLILLADEDVKLKEDLYREQQLSNVDYLDALAVKERYESMKNELKMQSELIKVNINRMIDPAVRGGI